MVDRSIRISPVFAHALRGLWVLTISAHAGVDAAEVTEAMWAELVQANQHLRTTVESQSREIAALRSRVDQIDHANTRREIVVADLRDRLDQTPPPTAPARAATDGKLIFFGEAGAAFFAGGANSQFSNDEFRIDEATLRLEAEAAHGVYLFGELQLTTRETRDESFHLGEFYVEFEDLGGDATPDRPFNLRLGRIDVPFGEEYLRRGPLTNPLITHSVSDIWGTDEGIELFGQLGRATYAVAVQNGGISSLRDFHADKSFAARLGFDPTPSLHVSASAMRTGKLDVTQDRLSEIWIGNTLFRSIGSASTTTFHADLVEVDATWSWTGGRVWAAIGRARYGDNDSLTDNRRALDFHQIGIVQAFTPRLYGAVRHSACDIEEGYPITGISAPLPNLPGSWTTELRRLSFGGGFRLTPNVVLKLEYAFEHGRLLNGDTRDDSDLFSAEAAVGF